MVASNEKENVVVTDLGFGDGIDEDNGAALQLCVLQKHVLAFGGDDGTIRVVDNDEGKPRVARRFDDPVRAVACSPDGKRVVVGFDDGNTTVFVYEKFSNDQDHHPFVSMAFSNPSSNDNEEDDDFLMSQSDGLENGNSDESFPGPRFSAPVRQLVFDPRGGSYYLLAIATEAGMCVVNVTSETLLERAGRLLEDVAQDGHDASGIRGLSYCPQKMWLTSLAMDGRACTWDVSSQEDPELEWELVHRDVSKAVGTSDVGELNSASPQDMSCRPLWTRQNILALPGKVDVQLRLASNISKELFICSTNDEGHTDTIVCLAASPDGNYLLTSGLDRRVLAWELNVPEDNKVQDDESSPFGKLLGLVHEFGIDQAMPTQMLWLDGATETEQVLHMVCSNGSLVTIQGRNAILPTPQTHGTVSSTAAADETETTDQTEEAEFEDTPLELNTQPPIQPDETPKTSSVKKRLTKKGVSKDEADDSDDDDVVFDDEEYGTKNEEKASEKQKNSPTKEGNVFVEDEAGEDEDSDKEDQYDDVTPPKDDAANEQEVEDAMAEFDQADVQGNDDDDRTRSNHWNTSNQVTIPRVESQPAFAPSSTPLDLTRRILCWNHVGTCTLLKDGATNSIDIQFVDSAFRKPISFTDNMGFIMGSLGDDGAIFASDLAHENENDDDDDDEFADNLYMSERTKSILKRSRRKKNQDTSKPKGSSIYFNRFETFGAFKEKDWYITLPDGELVLGCACGAGWAAAVTSRRFLRLFSSGGNQGPAIFLRGDPVTIVGRDRLLAVIYHEGAPLPDGTQMLGYMLMDGKTGQRICSGSLSAISSGSSLSWAGFSNDCSLMSLDTDGMMSMLAPTTNNTSPSAGNSFDWFPMLDTLGLKKSDDDVFWPITVLDGKLVCVPLKGGNEHPDATRRPVTTTLSFRMPLARGTSTKSSMLEEVSVRATIALNQKKFFNDIISADHENPDDLLEEYDNVCAQVDKVTLKLFIGYLEAGKVERALDLVSRLHLEKSFDVAITLSDRMNQRKLSDRIEIVKEYRFTLPLEDEMDDGSFIEDGADGDFNDGDNLGSPSNHREGEVDEELYTNMPKSKRISPDVNLKRELDEEPSSPRRVRTKFAPTQDEPHGTVKRRLNPFAKKRLESPAKGRLDLTPKSPTRKLALARTSTFSTQSREQRKVSKTII